jgi:two-component system sensor histidine kinase PilS (NtrC family)
MLSAYKTPVMLSKGSEYAGTFSVGALLWYLLGRGFIVALFIGGTVFVSQIYPGEAFFVTDLRLLVLLSLTFLQLCLSLLWLFRYPKYLHFFVQVQLLWDLILSILTVYLTGGISSLFPFLFIFVIIGCGLIAQRSDLYATVIAAVVLYTGLVGLQYYSYLVVPVPQSMGDKEVLYRLFLNIVVFLLAGFLGVILSARLQRSAQLLQRERFDYAELEQLNRVILQSIPSGLIVVNNCGKICAFNAAAATICGVTIAAADNQSIVSIFPELSIDSLELPVARGEFNYINTSGALRIIGYNVTVIEAVDDQEMRFLITFQDLTEAKKLEESLHLGERLAAVGKLAAGLAHEIRNPLASLGGSIQLLSEQVSFNSGDKHLFDIVQRETERLNNLVSDFLIFAKPQLPRLRVCDVMELCQEVLLLAKSDSLFSDVEILSDFTAGHKANIDPGQIHQALWNLLVNAAQFAQEPKKIVLGNDVVENCFWVEDNGSGVSLVDKKQIFEPFYTSRPKGTGLGLSIVHAIISVHGGSIECLDSDLGGARFQVNFANV